MTSVDPNLVKYASIHTTQPELTFDTTDPHTSTSEGTKSSLSTGARRFGTNTTSRANLDVKSSDTDLLASDSDVLGGCTIFSSG